MIVKFLSNMKRKEWNRVLDRYLQECKMSVEDYENLNDIQIAIIQELKKAFKRIKNNENI